MTIYKAMLANGNPVCTVIAKDKASAIVQIEKQLRKPGRQAYLKQWLVDGKQIKGA